MNSLELNREFEAKRKQLAKIGGTMNPDLMKKVDAQLNKEYKELLAEFHLISAKLSLLKKLCGESQRLTRQAMKRRK